MILNEGKNINDHGIFKRWNENTSQCWISHYLNQKSIILSINLSSSFILYLKELILASASLE